MWIKANDSKSIEPGLSIGCGIVAETISKKKRKEKGKKSEKITRWNDNKVKPDP